MEKKNEEKLVKVVIESYVIRDEKGVRLYRTSTREGAERKIDEFRKCYRRRSLLLFEPKITKERAIVECRVIRKRYPNNFRNPVKAGKTVYKLYNNDGLVKELEHEPKPMELINACAYNVEWKVIE